MVIIGKQPNSLEVYYGVIKNLFKAERRSNLLPFPRKRYKLFKLNQKHMKFIRTVQIALIICTVLVSLPTLSQDYVFRVLANKGANSVKSGSSDWMPLKTGARLNKGDALKLDENGYLGLVHANGRTLELKESGEHKIDDLSAKIGSGRSSVASKYADFVMSKMSTEKREENRRKYASVTGAVERATGTSAIKLLMPPSAKVFGDEALIMWNGEEGASYDVTVKDMFDEVIYSSKVEDSKILLHLNVEKFAKQSLVIINIKQSDNENIDSGDYGIKKLSGDEANEIKSELQELIAQIGDKTNSLNSLILAEFYEQKNLIIDALTQYMKAVELSPDVDYFGEVYQEFKMRHRLDK